MISRLALILLSFLSVHIAPVSASDLFIEVDPEIAKRAEQYNSRFMGEHLFHSKRHRIVTVNWQELLTSGEVVVTPFPGEESLSLLSTEVKSRRSGSAFSWIGGLRYPEIHKPRSEWNESDLRQLEDSGFSLESLQATAGATRLHILMWDQSPRNESMLRVGPGRAQSSQNNADNGIGLRRPPDGQEVSPGGEWSEFASVRGQFDFQPIGGSLIRLEPLPNSPRYHLVYELDPTKQFETIDSKPTPEQSERRREYERHMRRYESMQQTGPIRGSFDD